MMALTAAAKLRSVLTGAAASALKRASPSSEPLFKLGSIRRNAPADADTTRSVLPNTGEVSAHSVHPSHIRQCCRTDDFHTMDPLDRITEALDVEMEERKMSGATPASPCKLVFLGGPGVGKGTWASLLSKRLSIPHISTGDLVRKELSKPPSSGTTASHLMLREAVRTAMNQGRLLADRIIVELLWNQLQEMDPSVGFILDGFPRTACQASILDDAVGGVDMAVNFHLIDEALVAKCLGRRVCSECRKDYNVAHVDVCTHECTDKGVIKHNRIFLPARLPPQECASKLKVRDDDSDEAAVRERLRMYAHESEPLQQHYRSHGRLVDLDVGPGAEHVWPRLVDAIWELEHNNNYSVSSRL